jgi:hypothetical protein
MMPRERAIVLVIFLSLLIMAASIALVDWRRGWLLAVFIGVLQDPARKLTPGNPVWLTLSIALVYGVVLISSHINIMRGLRELNQRYGRLFAAGALLLLFLVIAAINGVATFGLEYWKVPALSFFIYLMPIPAVAFGYIYLRREEQLLDFFRFYSLLTAVALIGTPFEYLDYKWTALGMVGLPEGYIRYLPGIQLKILSGFYRAPDIMGWHAATLTCVAIAMAVRNRTLNKAWPWILAAAWGFTNCILSGRRKAVYMVAVFVAVFVWRYLRKMTMPQLISFAMAGVMMAFVVHKLGESEQSSVYTRGTATTSEEAFGRLEGGMIETLRQYGIMGVGLGTATQGAQHLLGGGSFSWQEGGLGKLAIEVGLPGILAAALVGLVLLRLILVLSRFPDEPDSSQLVRVTLVALVFANIVNFLASAQAYSDAVLTLVTAFFLGCLLATPALAERAAEPLPERSRARLPLTTRAAA